ncbi:hypothetical protein MUK42_29731 [Musa troglodytarum]|uniref:Uncharacterized protein n=1 Tax=Musa troglodytarum TaxID=320322 RepID=A0A9E7JVV9_9LILI|nr:hypothetical protein MUK42_29731 [Musa troglodytarum]
MKELDGYLAIYLREQSLNHPLFQHFYRLSVYVVFAAKEEELSDTASSTDCMVSPKDVSSCFCIFVFSQYPLPAALFGLDPFGYLRSRGVKKYHSLFPNNAIPACSTSITAMSSTWKFPRVVLVEIDLGDDGHRQALAGGLAAEVVHNELLVSGVEPEPRRQVELRFGVSCPPHGRLLGWTN